MKTTAWLLQGAESEHPFNLQKIELPDMTAGESVVKPVAVGWEGNMSHAILRQPIDINLSRGEDSVLLGNNGVVELVRTNCEATAKQAESCNGLFLVQPIFHPKATDAQGNLVSVFGYDMPGSSGLLSKKCVLPNEILLPLPICRSKAKFWASYTIRYMTAWSLFWKTAKVRLALGNRLEPGNFVGWGGGTTVAFLQLAAKLGHNAVMLCGSEAKCREAEAHGIQSLDISDLRLHTSTFGTTRDHYKYIKSGLQNLLIGEKEVDVICDFVGNPTAEMSLALLRRGGILATAGWKTGPIVHLNRAASCIKQHIHINSHHANKSEIWDSLRYGLQNDWHPKNVASYSFEEVSLLHEEFNSGVINSYFPIVDFDKK